MLRWALIFLIVALILAVLGFTTLPERPLTSRGFSSTSSW